MASISIAPTSGSRGCFAAASATTCAFLRIGRTEDLERTLGLRLSDYMLAQVIRGFIEMVVDKPFLCLLR